MTLSHGTVLGNKHSTEYGFSPRIFTAACGRNRRGADGAPPWRRPAAEIGRGGRATTTHGPGTGRFISRNRALLHENRGAFAREQGSFCAISGHVLDS